MQSIQKSSLGNGVKEISGGSKAIWPSQARRRVATGKAAQRRRFFILTGIGCLQAMWGAGISFRQGLHALRTASRVIQFRIALAACGIFLGLAALYDGGMLFAHSLVFVLSLLLYVLVVLGTVVLWFEHYYHQKRAASPVSPQIRPVVPDMHNSIPGSQLGQALRTMARQTVLNVVPHSRSSSTSSSSTMSFPETPVPATPLIRILETVDLSSSNVTHFLDTTSFRALASPLPTPISENVERKQRHSAQE